MRGEDGSATGNAQASDLSDLSSTAVGPDGPRMPADGAPQPEGSASDESAAGPSRPKVKIIAAKAASSRKGSSPKAEAAEPRHPNFSDLPVDTVHEINLAHASEHVSQLAALVQNKRNSAHTCATNSNKMCTRDGLLACTF